jgi:citrate lyase beta subunit
MGKKTKKTDDENFSIFDKPEEAESPEFVKTPPSRSPVHVVYGGADRYSAATPKKLGQIALASMRTYAANFVEFAQVMELPGSETLPHFPEIVAKLERQIARSQNKAKEEDYYAWFAWTIHRKAIEKLGREPVEDLRIDFEDGYGFRPEWEEDRDAEKAAVELATAFLKGSITPFSGFRIKSLNAETYKAGMRTLDTFLNAFIATSEGTLPPNFVVTLPKVTDRKQVTELCERLRKFEKKRKLPSGSIGVELMVESPLAFFDKKGRPALKGLVAASDGRCTSAHFGAYDYTSALGIVATHQGLHHAASDFARQTMLAQLARTGIRLSDSVTTKLPVAIHKHGRLSNVKKDENRRSVHDGWREHFRNVTASMTNGFYQSWDLHPNQLPARYAAVFSFFMTSRDAMADRLKGFVAGSTKATLSGNTFDDAASAEGILNFFRRGLDCGAFDEKEIKPLLGISATELRSLSFAEFAGRAS